MTELLWNLTPHVLNGVSLGLMFALIALGFMLIVGVMEVINLAHGSLFALGAYFAIFIMGLNLGVGIEARYAAAFLLAPLGVALVGMLLELAIRRTYGKDPLYGLLLTFGAALVIEEVIRLVWGSNEQQLPLPPDLSGAMLLGGFIYSKYRLYASFAAIGLISIITIVFLVDPLVGASGAEATALATQGDTLAQMYDWAFRWGPGLVAGIGNGIMLGYLMYTTGLMPRRLALVG